MADPEYTGKVCLRAGTSFTWRGKLISWHYSKIKCWSETLEEAAEVIGTRYTGKKDKRCDRKINNNIERERRLEGPIKTNTSHSILICAYATRSRVVPYTSTTLAAPFLPPCRP